MLKKTPEQIKLMREAGRRLSCVLDKVEKAIMQGITTKTLGDLTEKLIRAYGDIPSFLNYKVEGVSTPFPSALCASVNDEAVHGIPKNQVLKNGDIIGIDAGLCYRGFHADMARTIAVGKIDEKAKHLIAVTKKALREAIKSIKPGIRVGDIGIAIEKVVAGSGFSIVKELGGHGIGEVVHDDPHIPNFAEPGKGLLLEEGMTLAIEPIINEGDRHIILKSCGHTFATRDGKRSAHFEHTIVVTKDGAEILTRNG